MFNFVSTLSDYVKVGQVFVISGYASADAESFKIIFSCGKTDQSNAALVIAPSLRSNRIARSAKVDSSCVCEESGECGVIEPNSLFTFTILVGDDRFHVALNDEPYCTFKFQLSCDQIRTLNITGDIDSIIKANHIQTFPYPFPSIKTDCEDLALEAFIPRNFEIGDVLTVEGRTDGEFVVAFLEDESLRQLVHFNVRFDEGCVVMNSMDVEEEWSPNELRSTSFPFAIGQTFKIAFGLARNEMKIAVNGNFLMTYPFSSIELPEGDENLWEILTGIRVKNGAGASVKFSEVETIQTGDESVNCLSGMSAM